MDSPGDSKPQSRHAPLPAFFHPDCTVGSGISPDHAPFRSWALPPVGNWACDPHPAPKAWIRISLHYTTPKWPMQRAWSQTPVARPLRLPACDPPWQATPSGKGAAVLSGLRRDRSSRKRIVRAGGRHAYVAQHSIHPHSRPGEARPRRGKKFVSSDRRRGLGLRSAGLQQCRSVSGHRSNPRPRPTPGREVSICHVTTKPMIAAGSQARRRRR